jgi:manganese transport protein
MITRLLAIVPAVIVTAIYGEHGIGALIILSQVILALQLSFAVVPLVLFTSSKAKMGEFANGPVTVAFAWATAVAIAALNGWLLVVMAREWLA